LPSGGVNLGFKACGTSTLAALVAEVEGVKPNTGGAGGPDFDCGGAGGPAFFKAKGAGGIFAFFEPNAKGGGGGGTPFDFGADGGSLNFEKLSFSCLRTFVGGCLVSCSCLRSLANNSKASAESNEEIRVLI
jgi:hypothetical protein